MSLVRSHLSVHANNGLALVKRCTLSHENLATLAGTMEGSSWRNLSSKNLGD